MPCLNSRKARKRSSGRTGRTTSQMQYQATLPTVTAAPPPYATRCAASRHHHIFFSGNVCCVLTPIPPKSAKNAETPNPHSELRYFRPSLRRAPHYTCERGSRTLACRHGGCAASHEPPPAGFLRHLTAQSSFFAKTCQHFPHTFPKALPQTSAGCSVLGIIRGYKLRTCPSDRAIGAQPKGATKLRFLFGLFF